MATIYLIDGGKVSSIDGAFTKGNHQELLKWRNSRAGTRSVYSLIPAGSLYMMTPKGWTSKPVKEPQVLTMAKLMEAIKQTNWKEIQDGIQVDSLFRK